jgi:predicted ATP-grasp superfamily ATP-dependent carboligase
VNAWRRGALASADGDLRVLVTDVEERSSLAACRGLAQAGYRVTGVASMRPAPGHWSRSCDRRILLADPREDVAAFLAGLEKVLQEQEHTILLPSTDVSSWVISEHRERFARLARLALSDRDAVRRSLSKVHLIEEAQAAGLSTPPSTTCSDESDAIAAARELGFPVVVKPARSFLPVGGRFTQRAVALVTDEAALVDVLPGFGSPFIVQRLEKRGPVVSCAGLMTPERLLAVAVVRWKRCWPPQSGATSFCETIAPPPGLLPRVEGLLGAIGFQGIFELELLELGGGRFSAIDLNPRLFGWLCLPVRAGANLPALLCDWLCGRDPPPVEAVPGVRYRWEDGDLRHFVWQLRRGHIGAAAAVLRPRRRVAHAHFQLRDPAPLIARVGLLAETWLRRRREARVRFQDADEAQGR